MVHALEWSCDVSSTKVAAANGQWSMELMVNRSKVKMELVEYTQRARQLPLLRWHQTQCEIDIHT
jgi:hypothetical protein